MDPIAPTESSSCDDWQTSRETVRDRTAFLFNNSLMSDINFVLADSDGTQVRVPAHKLVLAISSPVFEAMFYGGLAETREAIELPDTDASSLLESLRFIYCEEVELTIENVLRVLYVAQKYIVPALVSKCRQFLEKNTDESNACKILEEARGFVETNTEEKCWEIIDRDTSACLESDRVLTFSHNTLVSLLQRDTLSMKEIELFDALKRWAEAQCEKKDLYPTGEEMREVLAGAVNLIRFPIMRRQDFARLVVPTGILTDKEVADIHQHYSGVVPGRGIKFVSTHRTGVFSRAKLHECYRPPRRRAPTTSLFGQSISTANLPAQSCLSAEVKVEESLTVTVEPRDVYLKGVRIATDDTRLFIHDGKTYTAELRLMDDTGRELAARTGRFQMKSLHGINHGIVVTFKQPVLIHKSSQYAIQIKFDGKGLTDFDPNPSTLFKVEDLYFEFGGSSRHICTLLFYTPD